MLVLDDLHAADDPSLLLLQFVAREIAHDRLLVVCALRDVDPLLSEPLTMALAELARESHCSRIGLTGLAEADVSEYIELATGTEAAPGLVRAIRAETEGNPLFVAEVVRLLDADGQIGEADAHLRIPPGVRAVIGQRVGGFRARAVTCSSQPRCWGGSSASMRSARRRAFSVLSCWTPSTRRSPSASSARFPDHRAVCASGTR